MAKVRSFGPSTQNVSVHPTEVDCEYKVVESGTGRVLHLSTFGSDARASDRKSSQSMQLDAAMAAELLRIIEDTFPGLRSTS